MRPLLHQTDGALHCHMTSSGRFIDGRKYKKSCQMSLECSSRSHDFQLCRKTIPDARCSDRETLCPRSFVLPASRWDCCCLTIAMMAVMDHWQQVSAGRWCSLAHDQRRTYEPGGKFYTRCVVRSAASAAGTEHGSRDHEVADHLYSHIFYITARFLGHHFTQDAAPTSD